MMKLIFAIGAFVPACFAAVAAATGRNIHAVVFAILTVLPVCILAATYIKEAKK